MTDWQKARMYDLMMQHVVKVPDFGHLFHYQIMIPAVGNQTFGEALEAMSPINKDES